MDPKLLIKFLRNLQAFYSLYISEGIEAVTGPDGTVYALFDIMSLYERRRELLSTQQAIAVELVLYRDMTEKEAALAMGLRASAPVSSYASQGAARLAACWTERTWTEEMAVA